MTQRRDVPQICTFDDLFRRYDLAQMKTAAFSAVEDTAAHAARQDNPHGVTKAQVGLGNADNTADTDKPLSTAALAEFSNYLAKTSIVDDLVTGGSGKVLSAEQGKILAQNDLNMLFLAKMKSAIVIENGDFSEEIFNYSWNNTHHYQYTELGGQYIGFRAVHQSNGTWQYLTNSDSNNGHKIYFSVDIKPASSTTVVRLGQDGGLGATVISPTFIGQWQRVSGIYTVSTSPGPRPYFSFGDTASSGWQEHFIRRVVVLDLTMLYGRGLEPATTTEVDIYVNLYLNHLNKPIGIRHGANANGDFLAFPNGALIMWGFISVPANTDTGTVIYPMTATSVPRPYLQTHWSYIQGLFWAIHTPELTRFSASPRMPNGALPNYPANAHWYAIGRWRG
ncbi:MAG: hypothetical protein ACOXZ0_05080 [Eubacteriales bacterium]|jgi:hypothetical protein